MDQTPIIDTQVLPESPALITPEPPKKSPLIPILIIIIFVLLIGTIGLLGYQYFTLKSQISTSPTPSAVPEATPQTEVSPTPSNIPTGWTTFNNSTCNVVLPIPPVEADADNRTWQTGTINDFDFLGFFKGKSVYEIHRNPTEASGFVSGYVEVGCGSNIDNSSLDQLNSDFHAHLTLQTPQNTAPETLIELTSNNDVVKWGLPAKEMTFVGGMFDPTQKYYLLIKSGNWYLVTKKSNSINQVINEQTNQIFNLLEFTN